MTPIELHPGGGGGDFGALLGIIEVVVKGIGLGWIVGGREAVACGGGKTDGANGVEEKLL